MHFSGRRCTGGHYDELPRVLEALTAAYIEDPRDAQTAAHIGSPKRVCL